MQTPTDLKICRGYSLFPAEQVLMPTSKLPYENTRKTVVFCLAHPFKIDPYRKFFRNRSVVFSQQIDLSLGDDELQKSPKRDFPTMPANESM